MVRLFRLLHIGLGLYPAIASSAALVGPEGVPPFADDIPRLSNAVTQARFIVEGHDGEFHAPMSKLYDILGKIGSLEEQVRSLLPDGAEASQEPEWTDRGCDAHQLLAYLGLGAEDCAAGQDGPGPADLSTTTDLPAATSVPAASTPSNTDSASPTLAPVTSSTPTSSANLTDASTGGYDPSKGGVYENLFDKNGQAKSSPVSKLSVRPQNTLEPVPLPISTHKPIPVDDFPKTSSEPSFYSPSTMARTSAAASPTSADGYAPDDNGGPDDAFEATPTNPAGQQDTAPDNSAGSNLGSDVNASSTPTAIPDASNPSSEEEEDVPNPGGFSPSEPGSDVDGDQTPTDDAVTALQRGGLFATPVAGFRPKTGLPNGAAGVRGGRTKPTAYPEPISTAGTNPASSSSRTSSTTSYPSPTPGGSVGDSASVSDTGPGSGSGGSPGVGVGVDSSTNPASSSSRTSSTASYPSPTPGGSADDSASVSDTGPGSGSGASPSVGVGVDSSTNPNAEPSGVPGINNAGGSPGSRPDSSPGPDYSSLDNFNSNSRGPLQGSGQPVGPYRGDGSPGGQNRFPDYYNNRGPLQGSGYPFGPYRGNGSPGYSSPDYFNNRGPVQGPGYPGGPYRGDGSPGYGSPDYFNNRGPLQGPGYSGGPYRGDDSTADIQSNNRFNGYGRGGRGRYTPGGSPRANNPGYLRSRFGGLDFEGPSGPGRLADSVSGPSYGPGRGPARLGGSSGDGVPLTGNASQTDNLPDRTAQGLPPFPGRLDTPGDVDGGAATNSTGSSLQLGGGLPGQGGQVTATTQGNPGFRVDTPLGGGGVEIGRTPRGGLSFGGFFNTTGTGPERAGFNGSLPIFGKTNTTTQTIEGPGGVLSGGSGQTSTTPGGLEANSGVASPGKASTATTDEDRTMKGHHHPCPPVELGGSGGNPSTTPGSDTIRTQALFPIYHDGKPRTSQGPPGPSGANNSGSGNAKVTNPPGAADLERPGLRGGDNANVNPNVQDEFEVPRIVYGGGDDNESCDGNDDGNGYGNGYKSRRRTEPAAGALDDTRLRQLILAHSRAEAGRDRRPPLPGSGGGNRRVDLDDEDALHQRSLGSFHAHGDEA
ncbi:hypothetical protein CDD80_5678 [Ophiocordyceps camponoti-rufipedis]|uniref:Uncharacterized protein n=1 Tax=Ophiocordyceps camponoti-rufipedis TaxID=2004952 RepID=A0A2C5XFV0_9HYPO|nr:hypothetical protein CDD80_5678 [Ophiocordyceps camponoti-rufipedis]